MKSKRKKLIMIHYKLIIDWKKVKSPVLPAYGRENAKGCVQRG
jgi:hypothetical protein